VSNGDGHLARGLFDVDGAEAGAHEGQHHFSESRAHPKLRWTRSSENPTDSSHPKVSKANVGRRRAAAELEAALQCGPCRRVDDVVALDGAWGSHGGGVHQVVEGCASGGQSEGTPDRLFAEVVVDDVVLGSSHELFAGKLDDGGVEACCHDAVAVAGGDDDVDASVKLLDAADFDGHAKLVEFGADGVGDVGARVKKGDGEAVGHGALDVREGAGLQVDQRTCPNAGAAVVVGGGMARRRRSPKVAPPGADDIRDEVKAWYRAFLLSDDFARLRRHEQRLTPLAAERFCRHLRALPAGVDDVSQFIAQLPEEVVVDDAKGFMAGVLLTRWSHHRPQAPWR